MTVIVSSRDFNQDISRAKRAANDGPVIITDRGEPAYVLLTHDAFRRLSGPEPTLIEMLAQREPDDSGFDFDPPRLDGLFRAADLD